MLDSVFGNLFGNSGGAPVDTSPGSLADKLGINDIGGLSPDAATIMDSIFGQGGAPAAADTGYGDIFGGPGTASQEMADMLGLGDTTGGQDLANQLGLNDIGGGGLTDLMDSYAQQGTVADESNAFGDMPPSSQQDMADALGANDIGGDNSIAAGPTEGLDASSGSLSDDEEDDSGYGSDSGYATGGAFRVPYTGKGGADTVPIRLNATGGETVSVGQGGGSSPQDHRVGGYGAAQAGGGGIHMHFHGITDMPSMMAPQSRLAMQRWARGAMQ